MFHRQLARLVLINDAIPSSKAGACGLIIDGDRRPLQVVKERLEAVMEERQPMLCALMFAPRRDRLIERVIGAGRPKFQTIALAKARDRRHIQDHL